MAALRPPAAPKGAGLAVALAAAWKGRITGALSCTAGEITRVLWLRDGNPVWVESNDPADSFTAILARRGTITENGRLMVEAEYMRPGMREEQAIVASGLLGLAEVLERARDVYDERLLNAFGSAAALWATEVKLLPPDSPLFEMGAAEALLMGIRERFDASRLALEFPISGGDRYVYRPAKLAAHPDLSLSRDEVRLSATLDGIRTWSEVLQESRLDAVEAHAAIYALALLEIVEYVAAPKASASADPAPEAGTARRAPGTGTGSFQQSHVDSQKLAASGKAGEMRARLGKDLHEVLEVHPDAPADVVAHGFKALIGRFDLGRGHWLADPDREAALSLLDRAADAYLVLTQPEARAKYFGAPPWDRENIAAGLADRLAPEKSYLKAGIFMQAGNHLAAEAALLAALQQKPREAKFHLRLGMCIYLRARARGEESVPAGAARALEKAAALDTGADEAWLYLGHIAMAAGDKEKAGRCYGQALALNPSSDEARRGVMRVEGGDSH